MTDPIYCYRCDKSVTPTIKADPDFTVWLCPDCNGELDRSFTDANRCPDCGGSGNWTPKSCKELDQHWGAPFPELCPTCYGTGTIEHQYEIKERSYRDDHELPNMPDQDTAN